MIICEFAILNLNLIYFSIKSLLYKNNSNLRYVVMFMTSKHFLKQIFYLVLSLIAFFFSYTSVTRTTVI